MSRNSSARYYEKNKERLHIKLLKHKIFFLKMQKNVSIWLQTIKSSLIIKNKIWLSIEKNIIKYGKIESRHKLIVIRDFCQATIRNIFSV